MLSSLAQRVLERPAKGLFLLCLMQVAFWSVLPAMTSRAPTLDVVEMLAWGEHWQLGYYKHPPLPAWIAEAARMMSGEPILGPMVASQLLVALTFVFVFLLGNRLLGARDALIGTALSTGVYYFSWPTPELNHNVVQMPIWAACFWLFAVVLDNPRRLLPWLGLGLAIGVGVYAKYSVVVLYVVLAVWILAEAGLRRALLTRGPWAGAALAVLVALPHLVWLVQTDFMPIAYAEARSARAADSAWRPLRFLLAQLVDHAPMLVPLAFAFLPLLRREREPEQPHTRAPSAAIRFLAIATLAPVLLTAAGAALTGAGLKDMWGAPMFTTSGLFVAALLSRHLVDGVVKRLLAGCTVLLILLPVAFSAQVPVARALGKKPPRNGAPMPAIAGSVTAAWRAATKRPLRYVGGDTWLAGLVAAGSADRPTLVADRDLTYSPWVTREDIARDGLLIVGFPKDPPPSQPGMEPRSIGDVEIPGAGSRPLIIRYAIYPPRPALIP
ncbi:dolichyl-phosphate-mannose-protein mannosyltransferase [Breoghania corrubedonensis]|uniref:Dolichyl-phosphate-mannose-protein mannosyltransferase n=1 Tax=Breoghania corrubedonensis TaxID=665038 RepID=A0A2T5V7M8_9HYPH|nr:glycosyltransferase family 39 protein [Breoghania corrubedonensis]PTW59768.1 dolichyl-phosphate-mannose-protein mannosyltransferase [Breoghania corrubedonensis]